MGKTETIKQRAIYVYLPSHDMVEKWKNLAKKSGTSISKFVAEHVENSLRQEEDDNYQTRSSLIQLIARVPRGSHRWDDKVAEGFVSRGSGGVQRSSVLLIFKR